MYWLPDSGTTAHMTPYASDLDPGSFVSFCTTVRVANGHKATQSMAKVPSHLPSATILLMPSSLSHFTMYILSQP